MSLYDEQHSVLPDDRRIFHRPDCEYDTVREAREAAVRDGVLTVELRLGSGRKARLSCETIADGIFRLCLWRGRVSFRNDSPMLDVAQVPHRSGSLRESKGAFTFSGGGHRLRIGRSPFSLELRGGDGRTLWRLEDDDMVVQPLGLRRFDDDERPYLSWRIHNGERLFGMGEKWNTVEKTGTRATIWSADTCGTNTCDLSYKAVPVLFSTRGWGMMLHSSYRSFWEIGGVSYAAGSFLTEDEAVDLLLFAAPTLKGLLGLYTGLTGRPKTPPKWALGVWLSRCQYRSRRETEAAVRGMRARDIPCDVVHIDPMWMKTHYYPIIGVDACDFDWNEDAFPDRVDMFRRFAEDNVNVCLWINPYLPEGTDIYEEALQRDYLVQDDDGGPARNEFDQPVGMVDFTNPEAKEWWKDHLKALLRDGASVFKPDYGERVPRNAVFHNGRDGAEMHNLYLFLYNQAVFEATIEQTGQPIIWGRSGYIGSQRYPGTWAGDTQVSWRAMKCCMRGGLSAGMTGWAWWSHDIGGFAGPKPSPELYIRWAQWGLLSPLSRFHGTTPREPWEFGERAVRVVRRYARLRYALVPYLLAAGELSSRTGLPIMRHMALEFPDVPCAHALDDQYMLGPDLLVAPVMEPGARSRTVYLPEGLWTELECPAETHQGGGFVELSAPLGRIPVLVREGAVIPRLVGDPQHLKGGPAEGVRVDVYRGRRARRVTYRDENVRVTMTGESTEDAMRFRVKAVPMRVEVRFLRRRAERVESEGAEVQWENAGEGVVARFDAASGARLTFS